MLSLCVQGIVQRESATEQEVMERNQQGENLKYCKKCRSIKPDRAHHCRYVLVSHDHTLFLLCLDVYEYKRNSVTVRDYSIVDMDHYLSLCHM